MSRKVVKWPSEHQIQKAFFEWLRVKYPAVEDLTWATPNAGKRSLLVAMRMKSEGLKPGVPDVFMAWPRGQWHGMFIEFKSKNGRLTDNQEFFINTLAQYGYYTTVVYSLDEAMEQVEWYLCES